MYELCYCFDLKRKKLVQGMSFYLKVVTSIPGIDNHDANAVNLSTTRNSSI
jgi:hypothetical protein